MLAYHSLHLTKLSLIVCVVLSSSYFLFFQDADLDYHNAYKIALSGKKAFFVESIMNTAVDGSFDNSTLVRMCASKQWQEGLIFKCEPPYGDAIEVRNVFLNCVRFALEAGATNFIVPELKSRSNYLPKRDSSTLSHMARRRTDWPDMKKEPEEDTIRLRPEPAHVKTFPFDHYFDFDHFKSSLSSACPQMAIISHSNDLYNVPSTGTSWFLRPERLTKSFYPKPADGVLAVPSEWRSAFDDWLNATCPVPTAERPVMVALKDPYLQFPLAHDPPEFVAQFGKIIRPRADVRELAATALYAMNKDFSHLSYKPMHGIQSRKFYGAQIIPEKGMSLLGGKKVTPYQTQEQNIIDAAKQNQLALIYLGLSISIDAEHGSSGSGTSPSPLEAFASTSQLSPQHMHTIAAFRKTAQNHSMTVVTRSSLLSNPAYATAFDIMNSLPLDVQLLIDYEVFLRSSLFGGVWESPSAWAIAMRRHVVWGGGSWKGLAAVKGTGSRTAGHDAKAGGKAQAERAFSDGEREGGVLGGGSAGREGIGNGTQGASSELSVLFGPEDEADGAFANALWP